MATLIPLDQPTEQTLIAELRSGDLAALDVLFDRYATTMLRLAHRLTGSLQDAEDVVQDVFVGLPVALRKYDERGRLGAWLNQVTARVALMRLRRASGRGEVAIDGALEAAARPANVLDRMSLDAAIASLPVNLRTVFVLREIEHYSHAEIASLLNIRRGTSEVRHHRAIRMLRKHLEGDR